LRERYVDTGLPTQYKVEVDPKEQLTRFLQHVEALRNRKLFKQGGGLGFSLNMQREPDGPLNISTQVRLPDEEYLRSFLLEFRQLAALQKSDILVTKVYNTCFKALGTNNELYPRFREWQSEWRQTQEKFTVGIQVGKQTIPPSKLADLWINGYYFHDEPAKRQQLEELYGGNVAPSKVNFVTYVINATRGIDHLGHLVAEGMKNGLFKFYSGLQ
jgi:hypothetical protein